MIDARTTPTGSLLRWVLPAALFVVIIGAVAWVSQNLPKSGGGTPTDNIKKPVANASAPPALQFLRNKAFWDADDKNYVMESEKGIEGYYDFPFLNLNDQSVTLGFLQTSCDCSKMSVTALESEAVANFDKIMKDDPVRFPIDPDWKWADLPQNNSKGIDVAAKGGGVVRVNWAGRKDPPARLRLSLRLWMQPSGKPDDRSLMEDEVPIIMSEPIRFIPYPRLSLGAIGANGSSSGQFLAYSSTRENLKLRVDPTKIDPLFETSVTTLDEKHRRELQENLASDQQNTRVKSLFRVDVRVHEQKGGVQLDQGPFSKKLPIVIDDFPFDLTPPDVTGSAKGDVEIGVSEDAGRVFFKPFVSRDGASRRLPIWSESGILEVEKVSPAYLKVELKSDVKDAKATRKRWVLEVRIPPNSLIGSLPEDAVIILKTAATRRVRVPVVGSAGN